MEKFDAIIIGSGLAGLECATILSKEGYNVCVLEKNASIGGCLQTYNRKGYGIDTGIHYIGSLEDGQFINQCFKYYGIMDKLYLRKLDEDCFDQVHYCDSIYKYAMGSEPFIETLSKEFPKEREGLSKYVNHLKSVRSTVAVDLLKKGKISSGDLSYFHTSAAQLIAECTSDSKLQNVLASTSLLYNGLKEKSSFYEHGMIMQSYLESSYRCVDGSNQIAEALAQEITKNGGTILTKSQVTRIVVENEEVVGVVLKDGNLLFSKNVISSIHPQLTLSILDKNRSIRKVFASRVNDLENSYGIFTVHLLMKENSYDYLNKNIYIHGKPQVWYDKSVDDQNFSSCLISMQASSAQPAYARVVSLLAPMYISAVEEWSDTLFERRGQSYIDYKNRRAEGLLSFVEKSGYDFKGKYDDLHITTPLSFRDYTGTIDGSAFGIIKDFNNPLASLISPKPKLKGLYFTGQNVNVHGALGVTITSLYTCAELLGEEYLTKKVGNA